jgi:hypothetical protein
MSDWGMPGGVSRKVLRTKTGAAQSRAAQNPGSGDCVSQGLALSGPLWQSFEEELPTEVLLEAQRGVLETPSSSGTARSLLRPCARALVDTMSDLG